MKLEELRYGRMGREEFLSMVSEEPRFSEIADSLAPAIDGIFQLQGNRGLVYIVEVSDDVSEGDIKFLQKVFEGLDITGAVVPKGLFVPIMCVEGD